MSPELLALLDARVKQQHAGGRAAYLRELIRRDALGAEPGTPVQYEETDSANTLLSEYHYLTDHAMRGTITVEQRKRLRQIEQELDKQEARGAEAQEAGKRQDEISAKLDQLLALVQGLPKTPG